MVSTKYFYIVLCTEPICALRDELTTRPAPQPAPAPWTAAEAAAAAEAICIADPAAAVAILARHAADLGMALY